MKWVKKMKRSSQWLSWCSNILNMVRNYIVKKCVSYMVKSNFFFKVNNKLFNSYIEKHQGPYVTKDLW